MSEPQPAFAVADTSVLLAVFNSKDRNHQSAREVLGSPRTLVISPLYLAQLDYLLTRQAGESAAISAVRHLNALVRLGHAQIAQVDGELMTQAEQLMTVYEGQALGLADTVNAALAWRLRRPLILTFDRHYSNVLAPRHKGEQRLEVAPPR
ncbi:type II toxin-antitoxin system VapC family toxin [Streptomyces benahoarensis]|uniref:type II toxin-antitoxin system VapC family toxin n=1 Tax=Streptomyces benahoarensis TaxID=2595054 RepID=UPI00163DD07C|nr:PIN domain-containing protein [Streptomyces benahoarensis]